jgi:hypothetical protein
MNADWYTLIEDYSQGKLSPPERNQLEADMAADKALAEAVRQHRLEWEASELLAEKELRKQIRQEFEKRPPKQNGWFSKNWRWGIPLLALLLIGGALIFQYRQPVAPHEEEPAVFPPEKDSLSPAPLPPGLPGKPDTASRKPSQPPAAKQKKQPKLRAIALAAYRPPEGLAEVRAFLSDSNALMLAKEAFAQKNYQQAINLLTPLPENGGQEALSLRAHAWFLAGDYFAAQKGFSDLLAGGVYRREAEWFGLLAKMAAPGAGKKEWLEQLDAIRSDARHPYQHDATALWERLEER